MKLKSAVAIQLLKSSAGVCLAEMMIAMAAGAVVLSATIQAMNHFQQRLSAQHEAIGRHQDQRIGIRILEEELRLAGTGAPLSETGLLKADRQEIEFLANLNGLTASLTEPVSPTQQELRVDNGSNWGKGKRIMVCTEDRCVESSLSRDGQRTLLSLSSTLGQAFPAGSQVLVSNKVRYYIGENAAGKISLMRQVDGGANTIVEGIKKFQLMYVDKQGKPTQDPGRVSRVRIELTASGARRMVISEVGLRGR